VPLENVPDVVNELRLHHKRLAALKLAIAPRPKASSSQEVEQQEDAIQNSCRLAGAAELIAPVTETAPLTRLEKC